VNQDAENKSTSLTHWRGLYRRKNKKAVADILLLYDGVMFILGNELQNEPPRDPTDGLDRIENGWMELQNDKPNAVNWISQYLRKLSPTPHETEIITMPDIYLTAVSSLR